jgi:hypothetical protein
LLASKATAVRPLALGAEGNPAGAAAAIGEQRVLAAIGQPLEQHAKGRPAGSDELDPPDAVDRTSARRDRHVREQVGLAGAAVEVVLSYAAAIEAGIEGGRVAAENQTAARKCREDERGEAHEGSPGRMSGELPVMA